MSLYSQKNWTYAQTSLLWQLSAEKKPLREMVTFIGKSEEEVRQKASELGMLLKSEEDLLKEMEEEFLKELEEEILKVSGT